MTSARSGSGTCLVRTRRLVLVAPSAAQMLAIRDRVRPRPDDDVRWADDYPTDGDVLMAGLVVRAGVLPTPQAPWGLLQVRLLDGADGDATGGAACASSALALAVGGIGFKAPPDAEGVAEIGYGLAPSAQRRGLATEAVAGMVEVARGVGMVALVAETDPSNAASRRVLEKSGFTRTQDVDRMLWWRREL